MVARLYESEAASSLGNFPFPSERPSLVVVLGPTTTGKTELATELARTLDGELINADKFYLFDRFSIGTGRADIEAHADLPRHLYGCLPARASLPSVATWAAWLDRVVRDVRSRGRVPIVEGSSFGLTAAAARLATRTPGSHVIGLRWSSAQGLSQRVAHRVQLACEAGLLDETEAAVADGLADTWVMRRSIVYGPMMAHLRGEASLSAACDEVGYLVVEAARVQDRKFCTLAGVRWYSGAPSALASVTGTNRPKSDWGLSGLIPAAVLASERNNPAMETLS